MKILKKALLDFELSTTEVKNMSKNLNVNCANDGNAINTAKMAAVKTIDGMTSDCEIWEKFFAGEINLSICGHPATKRDKDRIRDAIADGYVDRTRRNVATELYFCWCSAYNRPYIGVIPARKYSRISISFESITGSRGYTEDAAKHLNDWTRGRLKPHIFSRVYGILSFVYIRKEFVPEFVRMALELAVAGHESEKPTTAVAKGEPTAAA